MSAISDTLDRIGQIWVPGVEKFYGAMNPDPWFKADEDLSEVLARENPRASSLALMGYEARKRRMIDLYKQILELQEKKLPEPNAFMREFMDESVFLLRDSVLCGECKKSVSQSKSVTLRFETKLDEHGDPRKCIRATCSACAGRRAVA